MTRFTCLILAAILLVTFPAVVSSAADFDTGFRDYQKKNYAAAFHEWLGAANEGDPKSQHMLGFLYARGRGTGKNFAEAVKWWQRAAEQGHPPAQFTLGNLYLKGIGVARDKKKAAELISRAADGGFADAQFLLGILYARGEGVKRDLVNAYMYLDMAGEQKGLEPGANWGAITQYLSPVERREAERLLKKWRGKPKP